MTADRNELARRIYNGEREQMPLLYELCSGIISKSAYSFYRERESRCDAAGVTVDDLISVGYFALLEAIEAYNKDTRGYKFLAYLRYPLRNQFNALIGYRSARTAKEPLNNCISLDLPPNGDTENITLMDTIEDKKVAYIYDDLIDSIELKEVFPEAKRVLSDYPELYDILIKAYKEKMTVPQIAEAMGLTASQVSSNKAKARRQLWRSKKLKQLFYDMIGLSYSRSGLSYWKATHNSSVEWAAIKREQIKVKDTK